VPPSEISALDDADDEVPGKIYVEQNKYYLKQECFHIRYKMQGDSRVF
jgi:hypothetical protein